MTDHEEFYAAVRAAKGPTKRCAACQVNHPIEEFGIKSRDRLQVHPRCRAAQREASRRDYASNRDARKAKASQNRKRRRAEINELIDRWLTGRVCVRCRKLGQHLIAVAPDGQNIRSLQHDGFAADDVRLLLSEATAECRRCRSGH